MFSEMLEKITEIADIDNIGQLSENGGTSAEIAPSSSLSRYLDGSSSDVMSVLILSKHKNQKTALDKLCEICNALTRQKNISTDKLIAYGITVATQPNYVSKENDMWIYSCIVNFNIYNKEEF